MINIPNTLTLLRIALIPVFVIIFYLDIRLANIYACLVFILAALTDLLDGYIARKLEQTSRLGAFLDPVADKLMVAVVLVLLVQKHPTPLMALPAAVIIGREIAVSALREWMAELGARSKVAVSSLGKFKTTCQMLAIILLILEHSYFLIPTFIIGMVLLYIAAFLTLWSMFEYMASAWPKLRE
jgi:CDP-diacylglycerol--glycerol-3-phosphate 3-phosphatidyltransferase/cardiolipin synthase